MKRTPDSYATFKEILLRSSTVRDCNEAAGAVCQLRLMGEEELKCKNWTPEERSERKAKFKRESRIDFCLYIKNKPT